jgi:hypothetical protein
MVMPFDGYQARGRNIDGLIGYHFFAALHRPHRLRCEDPHRLEAVSVRGAGGGDRGADHVRRIPAGCRRDRPAPGDRTLAARLMVDTGASQAIFLRYPFASEHRLIDANGQRSSAPSLATARAR